MHLSAVILAGGQSRRMGRDKAWIELDGQPLIARCVSLLRQFGLTEVFISGRPGVDYRHLGCPVLHDLQANCGPIGGIERALHVAHCPLVLVLAVDLPNMTAAFLRKLHHQSQVQQTGVLPVLNGHIEPLAALYPKQCHPIALKCLTEQAWSARAFATRCLHAGAVRLYPVGPRDTECFVNWNTPAAINESSTGSLLTQEHHGLHAPQRQMIAC